MPFAHPAKNQQSIRVIREEVDRIEWALKEILPNLGGGLAEVTRIEGEVSGLAELDAIEQVVVLGTELQVDTFGKVKVFCRTMSQLFASTVKVVARKDTSVWTFSIRSGYPSIAGVASVESVPCLDHPVPGMLAGSFSVPECSCDLNFELHKKWNYLRYSLMWTLWQASLLNLPRTWIPASGSGIEKTSDIVNQHGYTLASHHQPIRKSKSLQYPIRGDRGEICELLSCC